MSRGKESELGPSSLPSSDVPSAQVLDELLRAFAVDVNDKERLERVDLTSPEVDRLLNDSSRSAAQVEDQSRGGGTTILIAPDEAQEDVDVDADVGTDARQPVFIDDAVTGGDGDIISLEDAASATHVEPRLRARRIAVKRAKGRKRLKWALAVVGVVAVVVAGLAVLGSGLFAIEDVEVQGAVRTDEAALGAVVEELRGTPVLRADTAAAEQALEAIPWVETARVRTDFPHGATIELRERTPVATFEGADGRYRVIDELGRVLDVVDAQPPDLMLVTAADAPDLSPGEPAPAGFRAAAGLAQALTEEMASLAASVTTTADGSDLRLVLTDGTEVLFGPAQDLVAKLVRLQTWLSIGRDGAVSTVDVSTEEVTTTP